jgi:hypothetical protein
MADKGGLYVDMKDGSKPNGEVYHLENIDPTSHAPENPNYLETDGLRTEGDGVDHTHYNSVSQPINPSIPSSVALRLIITRAPLRS